jgi:hypothetical protein
VLHIAGQKDDVVPFREQVQSVLAAKATDGSAEAGTSCGQNCTTYRSTRNAPVNTYFHPAGHVYPPGASEMIVKFFKNHELAD